MTDDEMYAAITAYRLALTDQLQSLTPQQWDSASLCKGWRVRDAFGHLVSILDLPMWKFVAGSLAGGFDRANDRIARRYGERQPSVLLTAYRQLAAQKFKLPVIGPIAPLCDVVIHSRDIGRPLGLPAIDAPATVRLALDTACGARVRGFVPKSRVAGLRFEADDLDWSFGSGELVRGAAGDVLLAVTGRRASLDSVAGPGSDLLRQRLAR